VPRSVPVDRPLSAPQCNCNNSSQTRGPRISSLPPDNNYTKSTTRCAKGTSQDSLDQKPIRDTLIAAGKYGPLQPNPHSVQTTPVLPELNIIARRTACSSIPGRAATKFSQELHLANCEPWTMTTITMLSRSLVSMAVFELETSCTTKPRKRQLIPSLCQRTWMTPMRRL